MKSLMARDYSHRYDKYSMSLPVFLPVAEVASRLPSGRRLTLRQLCRLAEVDCRVSGPPATRPLRLAHSRALRAVRRPGPFGEVWLGVPRNRKPKARALLALGLLAYGVFDYGARESLRGLAVAKPSPGPGRPISGSGQSPAERQRRYRQRLSARANRSLLAGTRSLLAGTRLAGTRSKVVREP
jgi:hypothetical protein